MVDQARKAIESLYKGTCDVYEFVSVKDPVSKITKTQEVKVLTAQPCKVSYKSKTKGKPAEANVTVSQDITLFIAPELVIKAGSRIVVTQHGRTVAYKSSGQPAVYERHQEIGLELVVDKA